MIKPKLAKDTNTNIGSKCKVHKYLRFSKKNKTYRTDIYYCVRCPHYIQLNMLFGRPMECWRCGNNFIFDDPSKQPMKPECGCKNKEVVEVKDNLEWLEEQTKDKNEILNEILKDIEK